LEAPIRQLSGFPGGWFRVLVTALVTSTKLSYIEPS